MCMLSENRNDLRSIAKNTAELTEKSNELLSSNKENINQLFSDLKSVLQKSEHVAF